MEIRRLYGRKQHEIIINISAEVIEIVGKPFLAGRINTMFFGILGMKLKKHSVLPCTLHLLKVCVVMSAVCEFGSVK